MLSLTLTLLFFLFVDTKTMFRHWGVKISYVSDTDTVVLSIFVDTETTFCHWHMYVWFIIIHY